MDGHAAGRFALVTAANHFLFACLPLSHPTSSIALSIFVESIRHSSLPRAEVDSVLVRVLVVLNPHSGGHGPSLMDSYVAQSSMRMGDADLFRDCVNHLLRRRGIGDASIQEAIACIESQHSDPAFSIAALAMDLSLPPYLLSRNFKSFTGVAPQEYLRSVRLEGAATALITTRGSVKEIWVAAGYNHAANFDHAFKGRFRMTPTEYRRRSSRSDLPSAMLARTTGNAGAPSRSQGSEGGEKVTVLIVDDDAVCCQTLSAIVGASGYTARTAHSGEAGLRELERRLPTVILLDYRLPDLTGVAFVETLRERHPGIRPPVALLTADWEVEQHREDLRILGATIESKLCDPDSIPRLIASLSLMPLAS